MADCAERLERSWDDNNKEMQSLIVDPSGIIIGQVAYKCALCRKICDSITEASLHYQVDHIQVAVNALRNTNSYSDAGSSMLPSTSTGRDTQQASCRNVNRNNGRPIPQSQRIQQRIRNRRDRIIRDRIRDRNQRATNSNSTSNSNKSSRTANTSSTNLTSSRRQNSNAALKSTSSERSRSSLTTNRPHDTNLAQAKTTDKDEIAPLGAAPKTLRVSARTLNGPRTRSTGSMLLNNGVNSEAAKTESAQQDDQRASPSPVQENKETDKTQPKPSSSIDNKNVQKRPPTNSSISHTSPKNKQTDSPNTKDEIKNNLTTTKEPNEDAVDSSSGSSRFIKTRSLYRSSSESAKQTGAKEREETKMPASAQTPASTPRSVRTPKRKRVQYS
ncbi:hypothetical protein GZH46_01123, partial [Fragariocoptes setiger]